MYVSDKFPDDICTIGWDTTHDKPAPLHLNSGVRCFRLQDNMGGQRA